VDFVNNHLGEKSYNIQPKIYFFERNQGYDTGQFVSFLNYSLSSKKFTNVKTANEIDFSALPVIPAAGVDKKLNSLDEVRQLAKSTGVPPSAGDLFIALPGYGGDNIDLENILGNKAEVGNSLVSLPSKLSQFKKWIYGKFDPKGDKSYRAHVITF